MKVLITGIAGFIGSHVAERFLASFYDVYGIDNLSTGRRENTFCSFEKSSIVGGWDMHGCVESFKPDVIVHLAAQPSLVTSQDSPVFDARMNILGTLNVISACQAYNVKHLVFASTSAVYHPQLALPISEDDTLSPVSNYGTSKLAAEFYIRNSGLSHTILRLGNVYGPRQVPLGENQVVPRLLSALYSGTKFEVYGTGDQLRDYVYVKDVAEAIFRCADKRVTGTVNVATGIGVSTNELVDLVYRLCGSRLANTPHTDAKDTRNVILSIDRIKEFWKPTTSLEDGLRETIERWPK